VVFVVVFGVVILIVVLVVAVVVIVVVAEVLMVTVAVTVAAIHRLSNYARQMVHETSFNLLFSLQTFSQFLCRICSVSSAVQENPFGEMVTPLHQNYLFTIQVTKNCLLILPSEQCPMVERHAET